MIGFPGSEFPQIPSPDSRRPIFDGALVYYPADIMASPQNRRFCGGPFGLIGFAGSEFPQIPSPDSRRPIFDGALVYYPADIMASPQNRRFCGGPFGLIGFAGSEFPQIPSPDSRRPIFDGALVYYPADIIPYTGEKHKRSFPTICKKIDERRFFFAALRFLASHILYQGVSAPEIGGNQIERI